MRGIFVVCLSIVINSSFSQNLVPNGDFESYSSCPEEWSEFFKATPWFEPNEIVNADYLNVCSTNNHVDIPNNYFGNQTALSGSGYAGIFVVYILSSGLRPNSGREYLEVELLEELERGETYCVQFYVSLSDRSYYGIDALGAYLSKDSVLYISDIGEVLLLNNQVSNGSGNTIMDTNMWVPIFGEYEAIGGEKFITIGNFKTDSSTVKEFSSNTGGANFQNGSYYYIDDVSVTKGNCLLGIDEKKEDAEFSISPNPAKSSVIIKTKNNLKGEIRLIDVFGNTLSEFSSQKNETEIDISNLPASVYYIYFKTEKGISVQKFIKL